MPEPMSLAFLSNVGNAFWTVVGIGLVIFVHELGHFLCARWVGVRVEVFSLGFGPRLFGFVRDDTDYRVSLVPFGGFVKMAGDQPGEGSGRTDELQSRSPGERFLIYSGGVLMNVVFALVAFPLIFWIGVPMLRPAVGLVEPGGPAWHAGLEEGDDIVSVNGRSVLGFTDIALEVALGDVERTEIVIERDGERRSVTVRPEYSEENGSYAIGIRSPSRYEIEVDEGGPADRAGLRTGDRVVALDGLPVRSGWYGVLDAQTDAPVVFTVARDEGTVDVPVAPVREENPARKIIGIQVPIHVVGALRGRFAAADAPLRVADRLLEVDGRAVSDRDDLLRAATAREPGTPTSLRIERDGAELELSLPPPLADVLADDVALVPWVDGLPGGPVRVLVNPGSPAERAGLEDGMRVVSVDGREVADWDSLRQRIAEANGAPVDLVAHDGERLRRVTVEPAPIVESDYGFGWRRDEVVRRFGPREAFVTGFHASWNMARHAYLVLKKMASRQLSVSKNLGGPVAISQVSYRFAESGLAKLFYFLALLSINLAVINLLPIPVLDGGHLMFILIEKVKGSPVNDRILGYSQVFGFVVILSLLVFVTYNDIKRLLD